MTSVPGSPRMRDSGNNSERTDTNPNRSSSCTESRKVVRKLHYSSTRGDRSLSSTTCHKNDEDRDRDGISSAQKPDSSSINDNVSDNHSALQLQSQVGKPKQEYDRMSTSTFGVEDSMKEMGEPASKSLPTRMLEQSDIDNGRCNLEKRSRQSGPSAEFDNIEALAAMKQDSKSPKNNSRKQEEMKEEEERSGSTPRFHNEFVYLTSKHSSNASYPLTLVTKDVSRPHSPHYDPVSSANTKRQSQPRKYTQGTGRRSEANDLPVSPTERQSHTALERTFDNHSADLQEHSIRSDQIGSGQSPLRSHHDNDYNKPSSTHHPIINESEVNFNEPGQSQTEADAQDKSAAIATSPTPKGWNDSVLPSGTQDRSYSYPGAVQGPTKQPQDNEDQNKAISRPHRQHDKTTTNVDEPGQSEIGSHANDANRHLAENNIPIGPAEAQPHTGSELPSDNDNRALQNRAFHYDQLDHPENPTNLLDREHEEIDKYAHEHLQSSLDILTEDVNRRPGPPPLPHDHIDRLPDSDSKDSAHVNDNENTYYPSPTEPLDNCEEIITRRYAQHGQSNKHIHQLHKSLSEKPFEGIDRCHGSLSLLESQTDRSSNSGSQDRRYEQDGAEQYPSITSHQVKGNSKPSGPLCWEDDETYMPAVLATQSQLRANSPNRGEPHGAYIIPNSKNYCEADSRTQGHDSPYFHSGHDSPKLSEDHDNNQNIKSRRYWQREEINKHSYEQGQFQMGPYTQETTKDLESQTINRSSTPPSKLQHDERHNFGPYSPSHSDRQPDKIETKGNRSPQHDRRKNYRDEGGHSHMGTTEQDTSTHHGTYSYPKSQVERRLTSDLQDQLSTHHLAVRHPSRQSFNLDNYNKESNISHTEIDDYGRFVQDSASTSTVSTLEPNRRSRTETVLTGAYSQASGSHTQQQSHLNRRGGHQLSDTSFRLEHHHERFYSRDLQFAASKNYEHEPGQPQQVIDAHSTGGRPGIYSTQPIYNYDSLASRSQSSNFRNHATEQNGYRCRYWSDEENAVMNRRYSNLAGGGRKESEHHFSQPISDYQQTTIQYGAKATEKHDIGHTTTTQEQNRSDLYSHPRHVTSTIDSTSEIAGPKGMGGAQYGPPSVSEEKRTNIPKSTSLGHGQVYENLSNPPYRTDDVAHDLSSGSYEHGSFQNLGSSNGRAERRNNRRLEQSSSRMNEHRNATPTHKQHEYQARHESLRNQQIMDVQGNMGPSYMDHNNWDINATDFNISVPYSDHHNQRQESGATRTNLSIRSNDSNDSSDNFEDAVDNSEQHFNTSQRTSLNYSGRGASNRNSGTFGPRSAPRPSPSDPEYPKYVLEEHKWVLSSLERMSSDKLFTKNRLHLVREQYIYFKNEFRDCTSKLQKIVLRLNSITMHRNRREMNEVDDIAIVRKAHYEAEIGKKFVEKKKKELMLLTQSVEPLFRLGFQDFSTFDRSRICNLAARDKLVMLSLNGVFPAVQFLTDKLKYWKSRSATREYRDQNQMNDMGDDDEDGDWFEATEKVDRVKKACLALKKIAEENMHSGYEAQYSIVDVKTVGSPNNGRRMKNTSIGDIIVCRGNALHAISPLMPSAPRIDLHIDDYVIFLNVQAQHHSSLRTVGFRIRYKSVPNPEEDEPDSAISEKETYACKEIESTSDKSQFNIAMKDLKPDADYIFSVQTLTEIGYSSHSEDKKLRTLKYVTVAKQMINFFLENRSQLERNKEPIIGKNWKMDNDCLYLGHKRIGPDKEMEKTGIAIVDVAPEFKTNISADGKENSTVILFVGKAGGGKSSQINSFISYLLYGHFNDSHTLMTIDDREETARSSTTSSITKYITVYQLRRLSTRMDRTMYIVDTPGYGDTKGEEHDSLINNSMKSLFNLFPHVNAVILTCESNIARATASHLSVVENIFRLLPLESQEKCFYTILTFSNSEKNPQSINALHDAGWPIKKNGFTAVNNGTFSANGTDENADENELKRWWLMSIYGQHQLLIKLKQMPNVRIPKKSNPSPKTVSLPSRDTNKLMKSIIDAAEDAWFVLMRMWSLSEVNGNLRQPPISTTQRNVEQVWMHGTYTLQKKYVQVMLKPSSLFKTWGGDCTSLELALLRAINEFLMYEDVLTNNLDMLYSISNFETDKQPSFGEYQTNINTLINRTISTCTNLPDGTKEVLKGTVMDVMEGRFLFLSQQDYYREYVQYLKTYFSDMKSVIHATYMQTDRNNHQKTHAFQSLYLHFWHRLPPAVKKIPGIPSPSAFSEVRGFKTTSQDLQAMVILVHFLLEKGIISVNLKQ